MSPITVPEGKGSVCRAGGQSLLCVLWCAGSTCAAQQRAELGFGEQEGAISGTPCPPGAGQRRQAASPALLWAPWGVGEVPGRSAVGPRRGTGGIPAPLEGLWHLRMPQLRVSGLCSPQLRHL